MLRKIKNTGEGGLGHYDAQRNQFRFAGNAVTEIDSAQLAEFLKDPIVKGWFDSGLLVDITPPAVAPETKPKAEGGGEGGKADSGKKPEGGKAEK